MLRTLMAIDREYGDNAKNVTVLSRQLSCGACGEGSGCFDVSYSGPWELGDGNGVRIYLNIERVI